MPAIRVVMPDGTTKSFPEATPKSVIRRAKEDMLAEMKASGACPEIEVTQHAPISVRGEPVFEDIQDYLNGKRPLPPGSPPQAHVPDYPTYITDESQIESNRESVGGKMDDLSLAAKAGGRVAKIKKVPKLPGALNAVGSLLGMAPIQDLIADHFIDEHNRRTARIYNAIGNNALKKNGGIR